MLKTAITACLIPDIFVQCTVPTELHPSGKPFGDKNTYNMQAEPIRENKLQFLQLFYITCSRNTIVSDQLKKRFHQFLPIADKLLIKGMSDEF
jgi:hypothetical protein